MGLSLSSFLFPPSPIYFLKRIDVPALAAGAVKEYDAENTLRKYRLFMPFTNFQIVNDSAAELEFVLDYSDNKRIKVLSGGVKAVRNQPFNSFVIKNISAAIATEGDDITIELETIR